MGNTRFHGKAQAYADARPGYPAEAMRYIASLMPDDAVIADIGAGTGKFTVPLARLGFTVKAVEPDSDMRRILTAAAAAHPAITVVEGSAAHTTLPDSSVDAITCAQSLHWFDHDAFLAECARIRRSATAPLISIYNVTSFDSAMTVGVMDGVGSAAGSDIADIIGGIDGGLSPEAMHAVAGVSGRHFRETAAEFFHHPTIRVFPNPIRYTRDSWRAYMDSHSHSPLPTDDIYPAFRAQVDAIFDRRAVDGVMTDDTVCMIASETLPVR